jgi:hypothetical protein
MTEVRFPSEVEERIFLFATASRPPLGPTHSLTQWVSRVISPMVQRPGCEANHWPTSCAKVKNARSYVSSSPYVFMACHLDVPPFGVVATLGSYSFQSNYLQKVRLMPYRDDASWHSLNNFILNFILPAEHVLKTQFYTLLRYIYIYIYVCVCVCVCVLNSFV